MAISRTEAQQLLERLIFDESNPADWVQDVWGLSPPLGESAAKLLQMFHTLLECCPEDELESLLQSIYQEQMQEQIP